ncbi:MAG TPA: YebC/PmpR family DNA-binding transcriptional regulator, partial [Ilumatobacteraceae bacterium]|nr:YebC/PmpR family DNA-binding transcriptional regulator [Ilumatobacteraceae bacterium]
EGQLVLVHEVGDALQAGGLTVASAESTMVASLNIEVTDVDEARKILRIMDALEDNDDVQDVYANFDISTELLEKIGE